MVAEFNNQQFREAFKVKFFYFCIIYINCDLKVEIKS